MRIQVELDLIKFGQAYDLMLVKCVTLRTYIAERDIDYLYFIYPIISHSPYTSFLFSMSLVSFATHPL